MAVPEITISKGVVLVPQRATVGSAAPLSHERVLRLLQPATEQMDVMTKLRAVLTEGGHPGNLARLTDDQVIAGIAAAVAQGRMVLQVRTGTCSENKKRFFDWLDEPLGQMAKDMNVPKQILLALGVKEGGWRKEDLDHNQPLNNPFGLNHINKQGEASGNKSYATVEECIADWTRPRDYIKGVKEATAFVDLLLAHGYNTNKVAYRKAYLEDYKYVGLAMDACGIDKETPK